MTITVKINAGLEFGTSGKPVIESKVFTNSVDFQAFMEIQRDFDAEDEIVSVNFDCK